MNVSDYLQSFYGTFGYEDYKNDMSTINSRVLRFLNEEYHSLMGRKGLEKLRRAVLTFSSIANVDMVALPYACSRVITVLDRTNMYPLTEMSLADIRAKDPGSINVTTFPQQYVVYNLSSPVVRDPTAPAELFVKSTSASDLGTRAFLQGIVGGYPYSRDVQLNGTTAVSFDATITTWSAVKKFYVSTDTFGDIVLTMTSGAGTVLSFIPSGRRFARYSRLLLWGIPSSSLTYYADVELTIDDLLSQHDEPLLPEDFHPLLSALVETREWMKRKDTAMIQIAKARAIDLRRDLHMHLQKPSGIANPVDQRFSQLGPYFSS